MAKIKISSKLRLDLIAIAAGQPDIKKRLYRDGYLEVEDVSQEKLESAVNHPSVVNPVVLPKPPTIEERLSSLEAEITLLKGA